MDSPMAAQSRRYGMLRLNRGVVHVGMNNLRFAWDPQSCPPSGGPERAMEKEG